jgi:hypothetical protein
LLPPVRRRNIPFAQHCAFAVSILVEAEKWVIADTLEVAVIPGSFLVAVLRYIPFHGITQHVRFNSRKTEQLR